MFGEVERSVAVIAGIRYLTVPALIGINDTLISLQTPLEPRGVLKPNELGSSQQRPAIYRCYEGIEDVFGLAAVLVDSLVRNHCFNNANKRTAAMAAFIFLLLNGYRLMGDGNELIGLLLGLENNTYTYDDLWNWFAAYSEPFDASNLNASDVSINVFSGSLMLEEDL
ncbi:type II toxin-antitoxin system death-on-curing family toxin [Marinobacter sp.]|uniref:type II toxin-antitoxin system death-on-curing family toxin n=1 Tax=Marinobacter sp. TaxID=50741 RepID=UPI003A8C99F0